MTENLWGGRRAARGREEETRMADGFNEVEMFVYVTTVFKEMEWVCFFRVVSCISSEVLSEWSVSRVLPLLPLPYKAK